MNNKLFKKLNNKVEMNQMKCNSNIMTENQKKELEEKIIFGDFVNKTNEKLNFRGE